MRSVIVIVCLGICGFCMSCAEESTDPASTTYTNPAVSSGTGMTPGMVAPVSPGSASSSPMQGLPISNQGQTSDMTAPVQSADSEGSRTGNGSGSGNAMAPPLDADQTNDSESDAEDDTISDAADMTEAGTASAEDSDIADPGDSNDDNENPADMAPAEDTAGMGPNSDPDETSHSMNHSDSVEPQTDFSDVSGPCCRGGIFEAMDEGVDLRVEVDACPDLMGCRVNGVENDCFMGHGSLLFSLDEGRTELQFHFECIDDEILARLTSQSDRITLRRVALCSNSASPICSE